MTASGRAERGSFDLYLGMLLLVVGVSIAAVSLDSIRVASEAFNWPSSPARVIVSEPRMQFFGWYILSRSGSHPDRGLVQYIRYEYTVAGTIYRSDRYDLITPPRKRNHYQRSDARLYPMDATVSVYYDPDQPGSAVLEKNVPPEVILLLVVGVLASATGTWFLRQTHRRRRADPARL